MIGKAVDIAKGIDQTLKAATFSEALAIVRTRRTDAALEDVQAPRVLIVEAGQAIEQYSRADVQRDYQVDVALQAPLPPAADGGENLARGDLLSALADQVLEALKNKPQAGAAWLKVIPKAPWHPEVLQKQALYLAVYTVVYRTIA